MKIPNQLKIGGLKFEVKLVEDLDEKLGDCDTAEQIIKLDKNTKQETLEETLFHEIWHAINNELSHTDIQFIAHTFYQVLKDNNLLK